MPNMTLAEMLQRINPHEKNYPLLCDVVSVDDEAGTVDVMPLLGAEWYDVRVNAEITPTKGLKVMPKEGSKVFILPINRETGIVVLASEITSWSLNIGESKFEQTAEGLLVQKGGDTLRDAIDLIIDAVLATVVIQGTNPDRAKLMQAKTKIQNLLRNAT